MFHRYILPAVGTKNVDFDRAHILMDKALVQQAVRDMKKAGEQGLQCVWTRYCDLHLIKYTAPFQPDVDPAWDT